MRRIILAGILMGVLVQAVWAASTNTPKAKSYYQAALAAYLNGNYDKAVLLDSKALQLDPHYDKAAELLNIVVYEMNNAHQTDIWIGSLEGPKGVGTSPVPALPGRVRRKYKLPARIDPAQLAQLEAQIRMINLLMAQNSEEQEKLLKETHSDDDKKWQDLSTKLAGFEAKAQTDDLTPMKVLCLLAVFLSIVALVVSVRTRRELKKYKAYFLSSTSRGTLDQDKIVLHPRFGR